MPIIENSEYENKVVVITGAGNGLGRAHAIEYAKRGAKIVINDLGGGSTVVVPVMLQTRSSTS